ncbi:hypothetical protein H4R34_001809 [Dimargaris verticillata]|uniref:Uncharacterized protein n=1 Tax=Dimargaris verticillata TaxID=2761393 RepID=A0A9W8B5F1_9FUNG|nr:hypothetical protein H4R34_001809 [Dimargaris verticillata]
MNPSGPSAITAALAGQLATPVNVKLGAGTDPPSFHAPSPRDIRVVLDQAVIQALIQLALADRQFPICGYLGGQQQMTEVGQPGTDRPTRTLHIQHFYSCPRKLTSLVTGTPEEIPDTIAKARHFFASVNALCLGSYQSTARNATILDPELVDRLKRMHARVPDGICVMVSPVHFSLARLFEVRNILVVYRFLPSESTRSKRRQPSTPVSNSAANVDPPFLSSQPGSAKPPDRVPAEVQTASIVHFAINPQPHPPPGVLRQVTAAYLVNLSEFQQVYRLRLDQTTCSLQRTTIHTQFNAALDNLWSRAGVELTQWIQQEYAHLAMAKVCLKSQIAHRLGKLREAWPQGSSISAQPPVLPNFEANLSAATFGTPLQAAYRQYGQMTRTPPLERVMNLATLDERVYWLDSSLPIEPIKTAATRNQQRLKRLDALLASHTPERRKRKGTDGHSGRAWSSANGNPGNTGPRSGKSVPTASRTDKPNGLGSVTPSSLLGPSATSSATPPLPYASTPLVPSQPGPSGIKGTLPPQIVPLPDASSNQRAKKQTSPAVPDSQPPTILGSLACTTSRAMDTTPLHQSDSEPSSKSYPYLHQLPPIGTFDDPMSSPTLLSDRSQLTPAASMRHTGLGCGTLPKALPTVTAWSDDQLASRPVARGTMPAMASSAGTTHPPKVVTETIHSRPASPPLRPNHTMHLGPVTMTTTEAPPVPGPQSKGSGGTPTNGHY